MSTTMNQPGPEAIVPIRRSVHEQLRVSVPSFGDGELEVTLEFTPDGLRLVLWMCPSLWRPHFEFQGLWADAWNGSAAWWHFSYSGTRLNRACFELAEVRPAVDLARRPAIDAIFDAGRRRTGV